MINFVALDLNDSTYLTWNTDLHTFVRLDFQPLWESGYPPPGVGQGTRAHKTAGNRAYTFVGFRRKDVSFVTVYVCSLTQIVDKRVTQLCSEN